MDQVIEHLPSNRKTLSSNPSTERKKNQKTTTTKKPQLLRVMCEVCPLQEASLSSGWLGLDSCADDRAQTHSLVFLVQVLSWGRLRVEEQRIEDSRMGPDQSK
jgi:hypothetical protein